MLTENAERGDAWAEGALTLVQLIMGRYISLLSPSSRIPSLHVGVRPLPHGVTVMNLMAEEQQTKADQAFKTAAGDGRHFHNQI